MAVNLIDSSDITVTQTGNNIQLNTTVDMQTVEAQSNTNASNIANIQNGNIYSANEVNTNETWINNKPIYRKVYTISVSANSTNSSTDLSSLGYDVIWINQAKSFNYYGGNTTSSSPVSWYSSSSDAGNVWVNDRGILNIKNNSSSARVYYLTIEYTKSS